MEKFTINFFKLFSIICLIVLLAGKFHFIGYSLIIETDKPPAGYKYSDLYGMCRISIFKELIPNNTTRLENVSLNDADIIVTGDSFFENKLGDKTFKELLQQKTPLRVFDFSHIYPDAHRAPLLFLKRLNTDTVKEKFLIMETVERYSLQRTGDYSKDSKLSYSLPRYVESLSDDIFHYGDVNVSIRYNYFLRDFFDFKSELNFNIFNQILNKEIGAFSVNPNFLFYNEETNFNKKKKSEEEINDYAESINQLSKELGKYKIKIIYVIIPDKFSIYNDYVYGTFHQNDYIPRVQEKLKEKNINYIDLYNIYLNNKKYGEWLYFMSDSHFSERGREILIDECIKKINTLKQGENNITHEVK